MELSPSAIKKSSSMEPKLTFDERCAVLALIRKNVSIRVIAAAFGINRRTVTHLRNGFRGYIRMHEQEKAMGEEEFQRVYVTEAIIARINASADKPETELSYSDYDHQSGDRARHASRRSSGMAGINYLKPVGAEIAHRIEIAWLEANTAVDHNGTFEHPAGWYWRDLDAEGDQFWNGNPEESSHFTSQKAFNHARQELNA